MINSYSIIGLIVFNLDFMNTRYGAAAALTKNQ